MQCPSCDGKLKELKFGEFRVLGCRPCDGFWLRKEEVNQFLEYTLELQNNGKKFQSVGGIEKELLNGQIGKYCPTCNNPTVTFEWGESDIISFSCSKNCGVWVRMKQLGNIVDWWQHQSTVSKNYRFFKVPEEEEGVISTNTDMVRGLAGWISDDIKIAARPVLVFGLILFNILTFSLNFILPQYQFLNLCLIPQKLFSDPLQFFYSIITSMFLHADLGHLFGNMFFLYLFGKSVEDRIGKTKFILLYLTTGIISALGYSLLTRYSFIPTLGASGAISGIMGAYLILFPRAKISFHKTFLLIPYKLNLPAWFYLGIWFVGQQFLGIAASFGAVAWYAHLFGFLSGLTIVGILRLNNSL